MTKSTKQKPKSTKMESSNYEYLFLMCGFSLLQKKKKELIFWFGLFITLFVEKISQFKIMIIILDKLYKLNYP